MSQSVFGALACKSEGRRSSSSSSVSVSSCALREPSEGRQTLAYEPTCWSLATTWCVHCMESHWRTCRHRSATVARGDTDSGIERRRLGLHHASSPSTPLPGSRHPPTPYSIEPHMNSGLCRLHQGLGAHCRPTASLEQYTGRTVTCQWWHLPLGRLQVHGPMPRPSGPSSLGRWAL